MTLGFVLPGFVIVNLAQRRRAAFERKSDVELVLRALFYAFALQLVVAATGWSPGLISEIDHHNGPKHHVGAVVLFAVVVVVVAPTLVGLLLGEYLRRAEVRGRLGPAASALGGVDARNAWDYLFSRISPDGATLAVRLKPLDSESSREVIGKFGRESWGTLSPAAERDLFLEDMWIQDEKGGLKGFSPPRGVWIPAREIEAVVIVEGFDPPRRSWFERQISGFRTRRVARRVAAGTRARAGHDLQRPAFWRLVDRIRDRPARRRDG